MAQPANRSVPHYEVVLQELRNAEALLRRELAHADDSKIRVREKNYDFLELLLEHPEYGPREYRGEASDYTGAERELRSNNLHTVADRQRLSDLMRATSASMVRLVMGTSAHSFQDYDAAAKVLLSRVFYDRKLESKILLIALHSDGSWLTKENEPALDIVRSIKRIATQGSYKLCREVARRLVGQLGTAYGFEKRQSRTELIQGTIEDISSSRDIDDLRMTLLFVQQDLRTLREESEAEIQNKVDAFVKSFFARMNAADTSHLLDTAASILAEINDPASAVNRSHDACKHTLELLVTMYSNLLVAYEVNAMYEVGTTLTIPWSDLSSFLVTNVKRQEGALPDGSPVRATVRSPGWRFRGEGPFETDDRNDWRRDQMKAMDFYIGIDFGTTNSVIARGGIDAHSRRILPEVIHIDMDGANTPQQIVPSAALYERDKRECLGIGPTAKNELMFPDPTRDQVTVSSVKLLLGNERVPEAPWLKPEEVASDILTFMRMSFEQQFNLPPVKKAVLGIPACAPSDMCERTIAAARLAGFEEVTLLVEPQAALLDFVLDQSKWEESYQVIDFSSPKTLVVFDLGGGTLDVSVVRVSQDAGSPPNSSIQYEELGLSRFADVGGDLFDGYLTSHLKEVFRSQTGLDIDDIPDPGERYRTNAKLRSYAEAAKQQLTRAADRLVKSGQVGTVMEALNKTSYKIAIKDLVTSSTGSLGFLHTLSYLDYVGAVEPLLGFGQKLSALNDDAMALKIVGDDSQRNIVRPVFDALIQAKHALGVVPKVDAVLLNGGMVRVHIVRERLKHLFGADCPFFEVPSPDLSVARGAVVHNYNITKRLNRSINILSEGILLEVQGSYLDLVREGTEYPTQAPIRHERLVAIPKDGVTHINLPLYRGKAGVRTAILERKIDLRGQAVRKGDVLDLQVSVDKNRMLKFEAWLHNSPSVRFDVAVGI